MKCPHCLKSIHAEQADTHIGEDATSQWTLIVRRCPACHRFIICLREHHDRASIPSTGRTHYRQTREILCHPRNFSRLPLPPEVPSEFADDYHEACRTLPESPKASAALSRRCLQHLLREKCGIKKGSLADEIQELLNSGKLPTYIADSLDAVRNLGNFAAHPLKSTTTGEILQVEPGEAEWNLDVLEALFDFYFVQPEIIKKKRDALNQKLKDAGKPQMK